MAQDGLVTVREIIHALAALHFHHLDTAKAAGAAVQVFCHTLMIPRQLGQVAPVKAGKLGRSAFFRLMVFHFLIPPKNLTEYRSRVKKRLFEAFEPPDNCVIMFIMEIIGRFYSGSFTVFSAFWNIILRMINLGNPHPRTLDNALKWLKNLRDNCDAEIRRLEMLQVTLTRDKERERALAALARDLVSENLDRAGVIRRLRSMGFPEGTVIEAARIWRVLMARNRRAMRNQEIVRRAVVNNEAKSSLAQEYGISRAHVHRIIRDYRLDKRWQNPRSS